MGKNTLKKMMKISNNVRFVQSKVPISNKFWLVTFTASLAIMTFIHVAAYAQKDFGLGAVIGDPTGLSAKYNISKENSIDAALAWSHSVSIHVHGDYLWNRYKLFYIDSYPVDWFFGAGARLRNRSDKHYGHEDDGLQLGARAPIGLRFLFQDPVIEVFVEAAAILNLVPDTDADLDLGIGGRFYF